MKAKRAYANTQKGCLQCQLNTGQRSKQLSVLCVTLQVPPLCESLLKTHPWKRRVRTHSGWPQTFVPVRQADDADLV